MTKPAWLRMEIAGIDIYSNDVRVRYVAAGQPPESPPERGEVAEFTYKSRQRLAFVASNTSVTFRWMTTLTYPREFSQDGRHIKKDLNTFMNHVRRKDGGNYLWWLEFQRRGAPHYHMLTENEYMSRSELSECWYKIVNSGDARHWRAGTNLEAIRSEDGARRYAVKYAMKMKQKLVPKEYRNVGRFWGHSKAVKPTAIYTTDLNTVDALADIIGDEQKARDMYNRGISTIYNASPLRPSPSTGIDNT